MFQAMHGESDDWRAQAKVLRHPGRNIIPADSMPAERGAPQCVCEANDLGLCRPRQQK